MDVASATTWAEARAARLSEHPCNVCTYRIERRGCQSICPSKHACIRIGSIEDRSSGDVVRACLSLGALDRFGYSDRLHAAFRHWSQAVCRQRAWIGEEWIICQPKHEDEADDQWQDSVPKAFSMCIDSRHPHVVVYFVFCGSHDVVTLSAVAPGTMVYTCSHKCTWCTYLVGKTQFAQVTSAASTPPATPNASSTSADPPHKTARKSQGPRPRGFTPKTAQPFKLATTLPQPLPQTIRSSAAPPDPLPRPSLPGPSPTPLQLVAPTPEVVDLDSPPANVTTPSPVPKPEAPPKAPPPVPKPEAPPPAPLTTPPVSLAKVRSAPAPVTKSPELESLRPIAHRPAWRPRVPPCPRRPSAAEVLAVTSADDLLDAMPELELSVTVAFGQYINPITSALHIPRHLHASPALAFRPPPPQPMASSSLPAPVPLQQALPDNPPAISAALPPQQTPPPREASPAVAATPVPTTTAFDVQWDSVSMKPFRKVGPLTEYGTICDPPAATPPWENATAKFGSESPVEVPGLTIMQYNLYRLGDKDVQCQVRC